MDRCPNCGAPAKPGAKFCTTCGYRLPVTNAAAETSRPESSWPEPPAIGETTTTTTTTAAPVELPTPTPASTWPPASDPSWKTPVPAETTTTTTTIDAPEPEFTAPVAPAFIPYDDAVNTDQTGSGHVENGVLTTGDNEVETEIVEETVTVPAPASQYEGWSSTVEEVVEDVDTEPTASDHDPSIARATALLDELRLLLPTLTGVAGPDRTAGHDAIRHALDAGGGNAASRDQLRQVLEEARDNPRDIQAVLAISGQAEAAITLLDDYDRLVDAARLALSPASEESPGLYK